MCCPVTFARTGFSPSKVPEFAISPFVLTAISAADLPRASATMLVLVHLGYTLTLGAFSTIFSDAISQ
jgi:hypothetical protein